MRILIFMFLIMLFSCKSTENTNKNAPTNDIKEIIGKKISITSTELSTGTNSAFVTKTNQTILDKEEFKKVWDIAFANFMNKKSLPEIDFENKMVLLVAMGEHNSGGYTIKINKIEEFDENIVVTIGEKKPGKTCMTTSVMTYPYQIVSLKKSEKEVIFKTIEKVYECSKEF